MSANNTPSHRPVKNNPYAVSPPMGPRIPTVSPPAQPADVSSSTQEPAQSTGGQVGVVGGARFSGHSEGTPRSGMAAFLGQGYGYSMYIATPQHAPQNAGPTIPARMSPGPALGPSATTANTQAADTPSGRSGSVPSDNGAPPSYESLVGRVSPQAQSTNPNSGAGNSNQSVFGGTFLGGGSGSGSGSWSVAAQHTTPTSTTFGSHGFHGYPLPDEKPSHPSGRFSLHEPDQMRQGTMRNFSSTFGNSAGSSEHGSGFPLLMQGVPRLTPYTQPSYSSSTGTGNSHSNSHNQHHQHHSHAGHQGSQSGHASIPAQMPTAGNSSNGPRPGASAHVFLMHKLRYIPLSAEYFIQQPRHQSQQMMGNGGMMHPMMQPDRPIQMFNGRGRPLQDFCPTADLFVAQLPFNMELTALQYLFDMVSQVPADIIHAAPHYKRGRSYDGCAFVKVSQNVAAILVDTFHKAALFDEEGVWVADNPEQRAILASYCNFMQQKSPQERRALLRKPIPFSAMTVEFANRSYAF